MAWGAVLVKDGPMQQIRDYWINPEGDINALEPRASCNALISFFPSIRNARIDVWTNNVTFPAAWGNGGCRSSLVKKEFKSKEEMSPAENFALHLKYVLSNKTWLTRPIIDCFLSEEGWARVSSEVWTTDV